jgi:hypothetical protein
VPYTGTFTDIAPGSAPAVTLCRRDWDKTIDALRSAARYLHGPPDPALLRIANDIEKRTAEKPVEVESDDNNELR